jgi:nitric oxide dioxygenase
MSLSEESLKIVAATLPAVGAKVNEITPLFYSKLFSAHPELIKDLFNRGNQAAGTQPQALARSIAVFATFLVQCSEQKTSIEPLLQRIAHKHCTLGVRPDQYPIVYKYLFEAIAEILGDAVTPEVGKAWSEVYWLMANALIKLEGDLYKEAGVEDAKVWRECKVDSRRDETEDVATFHVKPSDGKPAGVGKPGQFVSVQVTLPDGAHQIRQYSLSGEHAGGFVFSVKRVRGSPPGEVSNFIHANIKEGSTLQVSAPFGDVVLDDKDTRPLLLASGGIGITPMMGMLTHLVRTHSARPVVAVHGDQSPDTHAFREEYQRLVGQLKEGEVHLWYQQPGNSSSAKQGYPDLKSVPLRENTAAILCGSLAFLKAANAQLLERGLPASAIQYEIFTPDLGLS